MMTFERAFRDSLVSPTVLRLWLKKRQTRKITRDWLAISLLVTCGLVFLSLGSALLVTAVFPEKLLAILPMAPGLVLLTSGTLRLCFPEQEFIQECRKLGQIINYPGNWGEKELVDAVEEEIFHRIGKVLGLEEAGLRESPKWVVARTGVKTAYDSAWEFGLVGDSISNLYKKYEGRAGLHEPTHQTGKVDPPSGFVEAEMVE